MKEKTASNAPANGESLRESIIGLLRKNARHTNAELAGMLDCSLEEVEGEIQACESEGVILGYTAIVDPEKHAPNGVTAIIEIRITPERGGGFDRLAERIAQFSQVKSCYLISGGYDLVAVVTGADIREVASFVAEKLSTLNGVLSTSTHFQLKTYKENGILRLQSQPRERLPVTP